MRRKARTPEPPDHAWTDPEALPPPPRPVQARPGRGWLRRCLPLLLIPHVWIGIVLPIVMAAGLTEEVYFHLRGEIVPGRVTRLASHQHRKGGPSYSVCYTYQSGGAEQAAESRITQAGFGMLHEGDPVQVRVLPGSSRTPELLAPGAPSAWANLGGMTFFTVGWDGLLLLGFWPRSVRPLLHRALVRHGAATAGEVTSKEAKTAKGGKYYTVRYRYRTPPRARGDAALTTDEAAGREWQRSMTVAEDDYAAVGTRDRVTVLYHPRWPYWSVVYRCAAYRALPPS